MTDDATLSDFDAATSDGDETREPARERRDAAADRAEEADASAAGENDAVRWTYAWGDYTCSECDSPTERAWRADGEGADPVCPDCKSW